MRTLFLCYLILLAPLLGICQFQSNNWYFGEKAALHFDKNQPINLNDGQILYNEGLSSISDCKGDLIFYSTGENIYNAQHQVIKNGAGIMGSHSTTQGALITPLPNSCHQFYLFTLDDKENNYNDGLRYSIIDMNGDNGKGEVLSKNNLLYTKSTEKMCATHHANGKDFWIISHEYNSNNFYAYLLTENGLNPTPIISSIGPSISTNLNAIGQMKVDVNGSKIAYVNLRTGAGLFDFENTTGQVSNYIKIQNNSGYGVEFSPDGSKLYTTVHVQDYLNSSGSIYQFDILAGSQTDINQSKTWVGSNIRRTDMRGLQLAPDGKIYVARSLGKHLGVIENPNANGLLCNYIDSGFSLNNNICLWSFPNFVSSMVLAKEIINEPNFSYETKCAGKETTFQDLSVGDNLVYEWHMGDGTTYSSKNPTHIFNQKGVYNVRLRTYKKCCFEEVTQTIKIESCLNKYFIPNSFSPNNDGKNDTWKIIGKTIEKIEVRIFNRWGQQIFYSNTPFQSWDGKFAGVDQPIGAYAFTAKFTFEDQEEKRIGGTITLLR